MALGTEMRRGILAYFNEANAADGIRGRRLVLDSRNDDYEPAMARENMKGLLDIKEESSDRDTPDRRGDGSVFGILGSVGTPTMLEAAPMAMKNGVLFFAPLTGAQKFLRDGTNSRYIFNYRASYFEETQAIVEYLFKLREPRIADFTRVLAFTQDDAYGDAGYSGVRECLQYANRRIAEPDVHQASALQAQRHQEHGTRHRRSGSLDGGSPREEPAEARTHRHRHGGRVRARRGVHSHDQGLGERERRAGAAAHGGVSQRLVRRERGTGERPRKLPGDVQGRDGPDRRAEERAMQKGSSCPRSSHRTTPTRPG